MKDSDNMLQKKIVVIGAGRMGQGLAEAISTAGLEVTLLDKTNKIAKKGLHRIEESINREIGKWGLTESDKKAIMARISTSMDMSECEEADIVLDAIPEVLEEKHELFKQLDILCPPKTTLITNTATLSISEIASVTKRAGNVIGMHFLNPVSRVPLVEIVSGLKTHPDTLAKAIDLAELLDKKWITVTEYPGYVTTRIIVTMLNEAMHILMEGVASAEHIDEAMKLGFGFNIGPLALADQMGLDVVMTWMENLLHELSEHKYNPCPLLRKMVRTGHYGVKSGQGFFKYDDEGNRLAEQPHSVEEILK